MFCYACNCFILNRIMDYFTGIDSTFGLARKALNENFNNVKDSYRAISFTFKFGSTLRVRCITTDSTVAFWQSSEPSRNVPVELHSMSSVYLINQKTTKQHVSTQVRSCKTGSLCISTQCILHRCILQSICKVIKKKKKTRCCFGSRKGYEDKVQNARLN